MGKRPANLSHKGNAMTANKYAVKSYPAQVYPAHPCYNKNARQQRIKETLKTIITMTREKDGGEFTVADLKARIKETLDSQTANREIKESSIAADIHVTLKEVGGLIELRRAKGNGRGRPTAVYTFFDKALTPKGRMIQKALENEQAI